MRSCQLAFKTVIFYCAVVAFLCSTLALAASVQDDSPICPSDLGSHVDKILQSPKFKRARMGIMVEGLDPNSKLWQRIYSHDGDSFYTPASNNKLLTTAAFYLHAGHDRMLRDSFQTEVLASATDKATTALDTLCFIGGGDPALSMLQLVPFLQKTLKGALPALKTIENVVIDDTAFDTADAFPPSWMWEDLIASYGAQPSAFMLEGNSLVVTIYPTVEGQPPRVVYRSTNEEANVVPIDVSQAVTVGPDAPSSLSLSYRLDNTTVLLLQGTVSTKTTQGVVVSAPILSPSKYATKIVKSWLEAVGYKVTSSSAGRCPVASSASSRVGVYESKAFYALMEHCNEQSDNLYAEAFLLGLARRLSPSSTATRAAGVQAVRKVLSQAVPQMPDDSYVQVDGSGLSVKNVVSPLALVKLLEGMYPHDLFRSTLPIAGRSGTLASRFKGTAAENHVFAKTGTVSGVNTLSGYLLLPNSTSSPFNDFQNSFPPVVFSIMANHSPQPSSAVRELIDAIVLLLTRLRVC